MRISHIKIRNYRNIKDLDVTCGSSVVVVGENNSGKSNFLRALALPFSAEEGKYSEKLLSWTDINADAKEKYYQYLLNKKDLIRSKQESIEEFEDALPKIQVEVQILPEEEERYYVKDIISEISESNDMEYRIRYEFRPKRVKDILSLVQKILEKEDITEGTIKNVQMSLLPLELYEYSIFVPVKKSIIPSEILKQYRYMLLTAERDDFSTSNGRLGSKALLKLLQMNLTNSDKLEVEKKYTEFFAFIKNSCGMEKIINWQNSSEIENAKDFFKPIYILPNMPSMSSILNSVKLECNDEGLSLQGLGYRNIILLLVLLNSLLEKSEEVPFRVVGIEEPEAHLCINNIKLVSSFIKTLTTNNSPIQTFCTTHSTEFVNKLALENIVVMSNGTGITLRDELEQTERDYLSKNANLDLYKLFFSQKCILVEGLTEELLIRTYLERKKEFSEIEVLSFHKGYQKIIKIWKKINSGSDKKLGVVRDYDEQDDPKKKHEELADNQVCIKTTDKYTLEDDIFYAGNNSSLLMARYAKSMKCENSAPEDFLTKWKTPTYKASIMLKICQDLRRGELDSFTMPEHIQEVISFLQNKEK